MAASIREMLALAKELDKQKLQGSPLGRLGNILDITATGIGRGRANVRTNFASDLVNQSRELDIQKKQLDIQQQQENRRIMREMLSESNFPNLFQSEAKITDSVAIEGLGVKNPPRDNTRPGRVREIFDKSLSFSEKGGLSISLKPKKPAPGQTPSNRRQTEKDIENSAFKAAQTDEVRRMQATGKFRQGIDSLKDVVPPEDLVAAYKEHFRARFAGDFVKSDRILRQIKKRGQLKNKMLSEFGAADLNLDLQLPQ